MKIFEPLYRWTVKRAAHPKADRYLGAVSLAESSFFPIPVDVMLMPMSIARPDRWKYFAFVAMIMSVLGGLLGYIIGAYFFDAFTPQLQNMGWLDTINTWSAKLNADGFWWVLLAGVTPVPYKLFTIASGVAGMTLPIFIVGSIIGRSVRFFLVSWLAAKFGPMAEQKFIRYFDVIGWVVVALIVALLGYRYAAGH